MSLALATSLWGCPPAPRVCASEGGCLAPASSSVPSPLSQTSRLLFEPVDVGYVRRHGGPEGTPALATLASGDGALLLLRFAIDLSHLPPEPHVVEAFVLLERSMAVDAQPGAITLRAARIAQSWDSRSVSWLHQPNLDPSSGPWTRVQPASGPIVRVDVGDIVRRWLKRGRGEFGLAVEAEGPSGAGMTFALVAGSPQGESAVAVQGPRLELYVK